MSTPVAQGFLRLQLNEEEAGTLYQLIRSAKRYLIPLEVSLILKKEIKKTVEPIEALNMQRTWNDFCKEQDIDQSYSIVEPDMVIKWWEYSASHYQEPLPIPSQWES